MPVRLPPTPLTSPFNVKVPVPDCATGELAPGPAPLKTSGPQVVELLFKSSTPSLSICKVAEVGNCELASNCTEAGTVELPISK